MGIIKGYPRQDSAPEDYVGNITATEITAKDKNASDSFIQNTIADPALTKVSPIPSENLAWEFPTLLNGAVENMGVDGSVVNQIFSFAPVASQIVYVKDLNMYLADIGALVFDKFGSSTVLTNGLLIEFQTNGILRTISNLFRNPDISACFHHGGSSSGVTYQGKMEFGSLVRLDGDQSDFIRATVRDDLSTNIFIKMTTQVGELA